MREAVIVSAVRTPVGRFGGALAAVPAHELGALVIAEAVARSGVDPREIDEVIFGNLFANEVANLARVAALTARIPLEVPAVTIDRQCSSALNAIAYACVLIEAGYADVIVAGGAESDSRRCYVMERPTQAYQLFPPMFVAPKLAPDFIGNPSMGITAENVAERFGISRKECDEFAYRSHSLACRAWSEGRFSEQIVPVKVPQRKGDLVTVDRDETIRPDTSLEKMAALPPAFKKDGVCTAGNSSPMSDGAAAVVVMEKQRARSLGLEALLTFRGFAAAGVDPNFMGMGPVPATRKLLDRTGYDLDDIDLIELNEAFAAQSLAVIREIGFDINRVNVNGGAIALGHPLAATGAILTTKLAYELMRRGVRLGLVTFCCGGGQGFSALFERES